tara:strand:- start:101 stop:319 length:219 start_codon:yes stop_codon:yes gene_type:complete
MANAGDMPTAFATIAPDNSNSNNGGGIPDIPMPPTDIPSSKSDNDDNSGGSGGGGVPDFDQLSARFAALQGK